MGDKFNTLQQKVCSLDKYLLLAMANEMGSQSKLVFKYYFQVYYIVMCIIVIWSFYLLELNYQKLKATN